MSENARAIIFGLAGSLLLPILFYFKFALGLPDRWSGTVVIVIGIAAGAFSYWIWSLLYLRVPSQENANPEIAELGVAERLARQKFVMLRKMWTLGYVVGIIIIFVGGEFILR